MSVVTHTVEINAPIEEVFRASMDPARTKDWVTVVRDVLGYDDGPLVQGFEMQQRLCLRGVPFTVEWVLAEVDAPNYARWEGKGPARSKAITEDWLTDLGDGRTKFDYRNEFKAPFGPLGAVASRALTGGVPETEARASLERLKQQLESGR